MNEAEMKQFWDERARENAAFFVDNRLDYADPDMARFWASGEEALALMFGELEVEPATSDELIEVGCGIGRITRVLAARAASVHALDISERMVERARALNPDLDNVTWLVGDGSSLRPLKDCSADGCISDVVFQHIPDPAVTLAYVAEMCRVLRPGGWAAFQVSNDPAIHRRRRLAERLGGQLKAALHRGPRGQADRAWLGSAVELEALRERAEASGAELERVCGAGSQYCRVLLRKRETAAPDPR